MVLILYIGKYCIFGKLIKYIIMKKLSRKDLRMIKGSSVNIACSADQKCPAGYACCDSVCLKTKEIAHLPICD